MSLLTPAIILLLATLIQAFLQLTPSVFAIFYHATRGKLSRRRADDYSLYFYLGIEIFTAIVFLLLFTLLSLLFNYLPSFMWQIFPFCLAGICFALSIIVFFRYFRPSQRARSGQSTALFISRTRASQLVYRASHIKSRTDAFLLGAITGIFELGFSAPLYIICIYISLIFADFQASWVVICYIIVTLIPLFATHTFYKSGRTLADLQRFRYKNKPLFRLLLTLAYLSLVISIIILGVTQNGF